MTSPRKPKADEGEFPAEEETEEVETGEEEEENKNKKKQNNKPQTKKNGSTELKKKIKKKDDADGDNVDGENEDGEGNGTNGDHEETQEEEQKPVKRTTSIRAKKKEEKKTDIILNIVDDKRLSDVLGKYQQGVSFWQKAMKMVTNDPTLVQEAAAVRAQALTCFQPSAECGHAGSLYFMGLLYANGYDVLKIDSQKSRESFKRAAQCGHLEAAARLANCIAIECSFIDPDKVATAIDLWKMSSHYAFSQLNLGASFFVGYGNVKKDEKEAQHWLEQAIPTLIAEAENGNAESLLSLSFCYHNGYGVSKKDHKKGANLYLQAASHCHAYAQYHLAECLRRGIGVEKDLKKAVKYLAMAAKQGLALACARLGELHWKGEGVDKDMKKALEMYQLAVAAQDPVANVEAEKFFFYLAELSQNKNSLNTQVVSQHPKK